MNYDVDTILRQQSDMESVRAPYEQEWQDIARRLLPRQAKFLGGTSIPGRTDMQKIFDEYGMLALKHHTDAIEGLMIPRGSYYMLLVAEDDELMKIKRVAEWYDAKTKKLFARRYAAKSGFVSQIRECFDSAGAFGNLGLWIDAKRGADRQAQGLFYGSRHIGELFIRTNFEGRVDRVNRKFTLEARQAVQMWRDNPPECAVRCMEKGRDAERHEYIHALYPRSDVDPYRLDGAGMPIGDMYVSVADKQPLEESGYRRMPLVYSRYDTSSNEDYGGGPGGLVLPAVRACQAMMQSLVRATQLACEPPLGAPDEDTISAVEYSPRGITFGAVDSQGRRLVQTLFDGADTAGAEKLLEMTYGRIDEAFLKNLVDPNEELKSHVSASAYMRRASDRGVILTGRLGRQETELLDPMTEREVDIMADLGDFDDMPPEIVEAGGAFKTKYDSPLSRMRQMDQVSGFMDTVETVTPFAAVRPEILDNFDFDEAIRGVAQIRAVPARWMVDPEKLDAIRKGRANQQALASTIEAAPAMAGAVKDISQAQAMGQGA